MTTTIIVHKYVIGNEVYHITPDSPKGVVTDIQYNHLSGYTQYKVAFGWRTEDVEWYPENELINKTNDKKVGFK